MMIAADGPGRQLARLLAAEADGAIRHMARTELATLFWPGDVIVANDAATLPASLHGIHVRSGEAIEVRLAGWKSVRNPSEFVAIAFGTGDHRTRTEDRPPPPALTSGDGLALGPLKATVTALQGHPRLLSLRFAGDRDTIMAGLARHGRPIQYAHIVEPLALWDVWTKVAADPIAFETPSAGLALTWSTIAAWRRRGVRVVTLSHAAGISSTGDPALDRLLPFDEHYSIPATTAAAIAVAKSRGGRVVAVGTTVVRALESAIDEAGYLQANAGIARLKIGPQTQLHVVDAILSGVHEAGDSHFELLRAFADDATLERISAALVERRYRGHEFGDSVLIERPIQRTCVKARSLSDSRAV